MNNMALSGAFKILTSRLLNIMIFLCFACIYVSNIMSHPCFFVVIICTNHTPIFTSGFYKAELLTCSCVSDILMQVYLNSTFRWKISRRQF